MNVHISKNFLLISRLIESLELHHHQLPHTVMGSSPNYLHNRFPRALGSETQCPCHPHSPKHVSRPRCRPIIERKAKLQILPFQPQKWRIQRLQRVASHSINWGTKNPFEDTWTFISCDYKHVLRPNNLKAQY